MQKKKILMAIIIILVSKCSLVLAGDPGTLKWESPVGLIGEDLTSIYSSPALGPDGTVYIGSADGNLYAIDSDGSQKWKLRIGEDIYSSPAIGPDGTVYIGSDDRNLYAINPDDGSVKWDFKTKGDVDSSPAIGIDGTVYVGSLDGKVYAIDPNGGHKWNFETGIGVDSSPAIGLEGTIYIGSKDGYLYAINPYGDPDDRLKWKCLIEDWVYLSSPAIGPDGTVYVGSGEDNKVYAINPDDGSQKWSFETAGKVYSSPVIGSDSTVYASSLDGYVYAINPDGSRKWSWRNLDTFSLFDSSPAIGSDGTVYIGSVDKYLYAIDPNGNLIWSYDTGCPVYSSPTIGPDGTIYTTGNQSLLALHSDSDGLADSSWPMFLHDASHTGRATLKGRIMEILKGWSMISLPFDPENKKLSALFPDDVVFYDYAYETGYTRIDRSDSLEVGKGYWISSNNVRTCTITGQPFTQYYLPININGWLMIGGCSFTAKALVTNGSIVSIYGYEPGVGYKRVQNSANLIPGQGYWILLKGITGQAELTVKTF